MDIKWAICYSGGGNSVLKCLETYASREINNTKIVCVVSEGQKSPVSEMAEELGILMINKSSKEFRTTEEYQKFLTDKLLSLQIDYIFLQGYKYRIRPYMLKAFHNRIVNIHPSLLPAFKNTQTAIQDALDYGVKISGSTTHIIDEKIDEGIILKQKSIEIGDEDNFESLYPKFLEIGIQLICETYELISQQHKRSG